MGSEGGWHDARAYAQWLGEQINIACRLPSEAEWEYAARAGRTSPYALPAPRGGDDLSGNANCRDCGGEWAGNSTAPVASFAANAWGLYDMHGNVFEWVEDCYHNSYTGAPDDGITWVDANWLIRMSSGSSSNRVVRGGSWNHNRRNARSAYRGDYDPDARLNSIGFRVLCSSPID